MQVKAILVGVMFVGLSLIMADFDNPLTWPQAMVAASSTLLIALGFNARQSRRLGAIERYLAIQSRTREAHSQEKDVSVNSTTPAKEVCLASDLKAHLSLIVGERHPKTSRKHHDHVRDLIADHMSRLGWSVRLEQVIGLFGIGHNVIAEKKSSNPNAEIVIVGAHYDTVQGSPGADDNGIAVAGVMALGQMLSQNDFEKTVRLVAWDLEEQQGWGKCLVGSRTMAKNCRLAREKIAGVICLEMIGMCDHQEGSQQMVPGMKWVAPKLYNQVLNRGRRGDFIAIVANQPAIDLSQAIADNCEQVELPSVQLVNSGLVKLIRDLRRSDHAPFWDLGVPAVMVTDTSNFRSPFYHTALDRVEMIDFQFAAKTVLACGNAILSIAGGTLSKEYHQCDSGHLTPQTSRS